MNTHEHATDEQLKAIRSNPVLALRAASAMLNNIRLGWSYDRADYMKREGAINFALAHADNAAGIRLCENRACTCDPELL